MKKTAETDHSILPVLAERWSPRAFADQDVEDATLSRLFEAARWAPSCFNAQPWGFVVARRDQQDAYKQLLGLLMPGNQSWAKAAPVLIIGVCQTTFPHNGKPNAHAWYDLGQSVANLSTQATHEGLSMHQMAGFRRADAPLELGLPEGWVAVVAIALGLPGEPEQLIDDMATREKAPRVRKPQSDFVFTGAWGQDRS